MTTDDSEETVDFSRDNSGQRSSSMAGRIVGRYQIIRELGRGGQAAVYLAHDRQLSRDVALKLLPIGFSAAARERLQREALVLGRLDHPGICSIYEVGEDDGRLFMAMKYIKGQPLSALIANSQTDLACNSVSLHFDFDTTDNDVDVKTVAHPESSVEPNQSGLLKVRPEVRSILKMIESAGRAIHDAHQNGMIHRDIKPANIMVRESGEAVVLDFGLARDQNWEQATLTQTGELMGTPAYMSPEQIAAQRIKIDHRTDIYSLGASLYECLALSRPFESPSRDELYKKISFESPPSLKKSQAQIPGEVEAIVACAMEKNPDDRYATAEEFCEDIRRVLDGFVPLARPTPVLRKVSLFLKRRRRDIALILLPVFCYFAMTHLWPAISEQVNFWKSDEAGEQKDNAARQLVDDKRLGGEEFGYWIAPFDHPPFDKRKTSRPLVLITTRGFPGYICPECTSFERAVISRWREFKNRGVDVEIFYPMARDEKKDWEDARADSGSDGSRSDFEKALQKTSPKRPFLGNFTITGSSSDESLKRLKFGKQTPGVFIFDKTGTLVWGFVGEKRDERPEVETILELVDRYCQ